MYLTFTTQLWAECNIEDIILSSTLSHFVRSTSTDAISPNSSTGAMGLSWTPNFSDYVQEHIYWCDSAVSCKTSFDFLVTWPMCTGSVEMCIHYSSNGWGRRTGCCGRRTGYLWKTYSLIVRDISVDFLFTLCTFLPLYTSRGLWKCVSVHSDRWLGRKE
jgi:hypothetical protein